MSDFATALATNRRSIAEFVSLARGVNQSEWNSPPAPGKWSPAQVTEHVALAYEKTRALLKDPNPKGGAPPLLRPLIRFLFVRPILKTGKFRSGGKSPRQFRPVTAGETSDSLCRRLETAAAGLEADLESLQRQGTGILNHPIFGRISLPDSLYFQAYHTAHHRQQLTPRNA